MPVPLAQLAQPEPSRIHIRTRAQNLCGPNHVGARSALGLVLVLLLGGAVTALGMRRATDEFTIIAMHATPHSLAR